MGIWSDRRLRRGGRIGSVRHRKSEGGLPPRRVSTSLMNGKQTTCPLKKERIWTGWGPGTKFRSWFKKDARGFASSMQGGERADLKEMTVTLG